MLNLVNAKNLINNYIDETSFMDVFLNLESQILNVEMGKLEYLPGCRQIRD